MTLPYKVDLPLEKAYSAFIYDELEEYEQVIEGLTDHIEKNPKDSIAINNRGVAYIEIGEREKAIADFRKAVELTTNGVMFRNLGAALEKKDINEAIKQYTKAIEIEGDEMYPFICRAHAFEKIGKYEDAIADYTKALNISPDHEYTYKSRAKCYRKIGEVDKAKKDEEFNSKQK